MKALNLSLINMFRAYYDSKANEDVWNAFNIMYNLGFIDHKTWLRFFEACKDWVWDEQKQEVTTMFTDIE